MTESRRHGFQQLADEVVRSVRERLVGLTADDLRVAAVVHYGAVDIDARHLVVWILLSGRADDELPAWLAVTPELLSDLRPTLVDHGWLLRLRAVIVAELTDRGWPDAEATAVMIDSAHRVEVNGGWNYFR